MKAIIEIVGCIIFWVIVIFCAVFVFAFLGAMNDIGPVRFVGGYPGFPGAMPPDSREAFHRRRKADPEWYKMVQQNDGRFSARDLEGWENARSK